MVTIALPAVSGLSNGTTFVVKRLGGSGTVIVVSAGGENIDATTPAMIGKPWGKMTLQTDGTSAWNIIAQ